MDKRSSFLVDASEKAKSISVGIKVKPLGKMVNQVITSFGSGFVISAENGKAVIATNGHVLAGTGSEISMEIVMPDGTVQDGKILYVHELTDIGFLEINIPQKNQCQATLRDTSSLPLRTGEFVVAFGHPPDNPSQGTAGIVAHTKRKFDIEGKDSLLDYIQSTAPAQAGNSGGPMTDANGRVIGMLCAIAPTISNTQ